MNEEPKTFEQFIGQDHNKRELEAMLNAKDTSSLLIRGNYGGGKTTLAKIYASYRGYYTYQDVPDILKIPDGMEAVTHIIDEIHLAGQFEVLYNQIGKKTFVFCTTERTALPAPFVSRCIEIVLSDYSEDELVKIISERAVKAEISISEPAVVLIASRCRYTPRVGIQLLKRVNNLGMLDRQELNLEYVTMILESLRVYDNGLIEDDIRYIRALGDSQSPLALGTLSAILNRDRSYVQDTVEQFLLYKRMISITPRGRILTDNGRSIAEEIRRMNES